MIALERERESERGVRELGMEGKRVIFHTIIFDHEKLEPTIIIIFFFVIQTNP